MNPVFIFEQYHLDGCGNKRIDAYIPVENIEVGKHFIKSVIETEYSDNRFKIDEVPEENATIITIKDECKSSFDIFDHTVLCVREMVPINHQQIIKAVQINKERNKNTEGYSFQEWHLK